MYYSLANLKSAFKRDVVIAGNYSNTTNYGVLEDVELVDTAKKGVFLLKSEATITNRNIVHLVYNPKIYELGELSAPVILDVGTHRIVAGFRPFSSSFSVDELDYFVRIYVESTILGSR